jgi:hypothetical protein
MNDAHGFPFTESPPQVNFGYYRLRDGLPTPDTRVTVIPNSYSTIGPTICMWDDIEREFAPFDPTLVPLVGEHIPWWNIAVWTPNPSPPVDADWVWEAGDDEGSIHFIAPGTFTDGPHDDINKVVLNLREVGAADWIVYDNFNLYDDQLLPGFTPGSSYEARVAWTTDIQDFLWLSVNLSPFTSPPKVVGPL